MRAKVVFPPLIRARHDKYAFLPVETEIIADDDRPFGDERICEGQIEGVIDAKFLVLAESVG